VPRRALGLVGIMALVGVGGCGSGSRTDLASPVITRAITIAYRDVFADFGSSNARRFCGDLTPRAAQSVASELRGKSCGVAAARLFALDAQSRRAAASSSGAFGRDFHIGSVELRGRQASANVGFGPLHGLPFRIDFQKIAGRWLVADPPHLTGAFGCRPHRADRCGVTAMSIR
jgi:hypothetical protein